MATGKASVLRRELPQLTCAPSVRICVCGDEGSGKSSLITCLVKDTFVNNKIQPVLPQITIPPTLGTPENVTTTIVDTSALPQERVNLAREIRKSNVILLVYSDHYSYERVALFWLPYFRSLGVNVPVVLCANKSDLAANGSSPQVVEEEMLPVMAEFKEIDSCIRTSAREHYNVNEAFFLCQKAVTDPIAPLFDSKESMLKPAAVAALQRVFYLCDKDKDGILSDKEMEDFQMKCFNKSLNPEDLEHIKDTIRRVSPGGVTLTGINAEGFVSLCKIYAEKGRHETVWIILRTFQYTNNLSLQEHFLHPKFDVPEYASAELSPAGYRFLVDLFLTSDKDNDGGLRNAELASLFAPTPGMPQSWIDNSFPACTVRNDAGYVTLQGWLAQWSMTTFISPKTTLEYLAYLGFESTDRSNPTTTAALKLTKPRKRRRRPGRIGRNVVLCNVLGAPSSGKSSLLDAFLSRPFSSMYHPTIQPRVAVNTVELPGGRQCYLILNELGEPEPAVLDNKKKLLDQCDVIVYTYDSSDPNSFAYIPNIRAKYPHLEELPSVYVALKADLDRTTQRAENQPDEYTVQVQKMPQGPPIHTSVTWPSIQELFVTISEAALEPVTAFPRSHEEDDDGKWMRYGIAFSAVVCAGTAAVVTWKRASGSTVSAS
jgi:mitochondrial Rho GTPase 1